MNALRTKINVTYNTGRVTGSETGIMTMIILAYNHVYQNNNHSLEVQYQYVTSENEIIKNDVFSLSDSASINAMYEAVKGLIPPFTTLTNEWDNEVLAGATVEFANTFGIQVTDIEQVNE